MEEFKSSAFSNGNIDKEAPQLVTVLKEMKDGLDKVTAKIQALTTKVKADHFPTADGISYLEAKHLLLLNYCQSLVYYLLRKAKGFSIEGHPVVRSLVEIRLFLEKIRPIDKKLQYQIQKLTRVTEDAEEKPSPSEKNLRATQKTDDLFKYRPNPDMIIPKLNANLKDDGGVYQPPKFAPVSMEEDKGMSKQKKRKEQEMLRQAKQNDYIKSFVNDLEGRPEEIKESLGAESREHKRYLENWERREQQEEDLFTRAPVTKADKKRQKQLMRSSHGLLGLTESFFDDIKSLPLEGSVPERSGGLGSDDRAAKRRQRRH